ncbi:hypothetical protein LDENG_00216660 [Lucifuga dentata]|nr:hypothetical protein LDENG_00216660 [Lucifuga dentata]
MRSAGRNQRDETDIWRLRFGHTGLNISLFKIGNHNSGRRSYCYVDETIEHVMIECPQYTEERRELMNSLKERKVKFNLRDMLQQSSGALCYSVLFHYLRRTGLSIRI